MIHWKWFGDIRYKEGPTACVWRILTNICQAPWETAAQLNNMDPTLHCTPRMWEHSQTTSLKMLNNYPATLILFGEKTRMCPLVLD